MNQKSCGHCHKDLTKLDYSDQAKHVRTCKGGYNRE